ncbi:unnamed protein product [Prorocentrum cordatum]|uniref:TIR domain-containing protein n=1 Tax=Prorocentrum cordatum TaxID=2364126 RepID=A0ABN9PNM2_9DINO|nr:unnamed protein product [Polarella glacialis]
MVSLLRWVSLVAFDIEIVNVNCLFGSEPLNTFAFQVGFVFVAFGVLLLYHCTVVVWRHHGNFRRRLPSLWASLGTITQIFYISIITTVVGPFQCLKHPNERWTMRAYQSVICWESNEHSAMLAIGLVALLFPLAFLAKCCQVVWGFPAKLKLGKTRVLKSFTFLFFRYKTECYWYSVVHMLRSLAIGLTPAIPDLSAQVLIMQSVLLLQLICTVYWSPWRVPQATRFDILSTTTMLVVVGCAAFYVDAPPDSALAVLAAMLGHGGGSGLLLGLLLTVVWKLAHAALRRRDKEFDFFLCHHKLAAGSCARLLKVQLCSRGGSRRRVFLDCDDLKDLETLFDTVANRVQVFVTLCTKELFLRPWCMGEVITAHHCKLQTVKLVFPDFTEPDEAYIFEYEDSSKDLSVLTGYGYSIEDVRVALRWVPQITSYSIPSAITSVSMEEIADRLEDCIISHSPSGTRGSPRGPSGRANRASIGGNSTWIIHDESSLEAGATAAVMAHLLMVSFVHIPFEIPQVLLGGRDVPDSATKLIILCTSNVLQQPSILKHFERGIDLDVCFYPVIGDEGFRFPGASFKKDTMKLAAAILDDPDEVLSAVLAMFKAIAGSFLASSSSATVLANQAAELARRVQSLSRRAQTPAPSAMVRQASESRGTGDESHASVCRMKQRRALCWPPPVGGLCSRAPCGPWAAGGAPRPPPGAVQESRREVSHYEEAGRGSGAGSAGPCAEAAADASLSW